MSPTIRYLLLLFVTIVLIVGTASIIIAFGRGYRLDFKKNSVKTTGLISATSEPVGAQVYIDGKLKTATNNSFDLDPGWYKVTIRKESFISWEKTIRVQGEIVSRADAYLFPSNAGLSPLTTFGVTHPTLSPDNTKIAYIVPQASTNSEKSGLWVFELAESPLGRNRDPIHIDEASDGYNFDSASLTWSPDSTQLLVQAPLATNRLYQTNRTNSPSLISTAETNQLISDWHVEHDQKISQQLASFKQPIIEIATSSARIIAFSPDESKILYEATAAATIPQIIKPALIGTNPTTEERSIKPGTIYVYDAKEDRNYFLLKSSELPNISPTPSKKLSRFTPTPTSAPRSLSTVPLLWFPTSRHIMVVYPEKIDIMEYDRTNWITIYSGPFDASFVTPWPNGSRIVILTSLNAKAATIPNLYTVNLK
jgi:dipeptidyl aminopeptidase/acylaminoacyl peptidase